MVTYNSKLVTFLSGKNTIIIKDENSFNVFKELMEKIGLNFNYVNYQYLKEIAALNNFLIGDNVILVEYRNELGFCLGRTSFKRSEDWFGEAPFELFEVIAEM